MQVPHLFAKPGHFRNLDVATSKKAFLDLQLHVLQLATSNSQNWVRFVVQNCTSDTPLWVCLDFEANEISSNLFLTSKKNETTNSQIHKFKVLQNVFESL